MAKRALPNLGLVGNFATGDDDWGPDMDATLLKLSTLVQGGAKSRLAAVPGAPAQGDVHILTAAPNDNAVAVYDGGAWIYYQPSEGWLLWDKGADTYVTFDGFDWVVLATGGGGGGGGDGIADAPEDGKLYGRKDADWEEIVAGGGGGGGEANPSISITPALQNGWLDYEYDGFGGYGASKSGRVVTMVGLVKNGAANAPIFTLPVGWRPSKNLQMTTNTNDGATRLNVLSTGEVQVTGYNLYVGLNLSFLVPEEDAYSPAGGGGGGGGGGGEIGAHSYWALYSFRNNGDGYTGTNEVNFLDASATRVPNGSGGNAIASGSNGAGGPEAAFDGSKGPYDPYGESRWQTQETHNCFIGYHYIVPVEVHGIGLYGAYFENQTPRDFALMYSDDGKVWHTVMTVLGQTGWGYNQYRTFMA